MGRFAYGASNVRLAHASLSLGSSGPSDCPSMPHKRVTVTSFITPLLRPMDPPLKYCIDFSLRSMTRPDTNGPLSLMRTTIERPFGAWTIASHIAQRPYPHLYCFAIAS